MRGVEREGERERRGERERERGGGGREGEKTDFKDDCLHGHYEVYLHP